MPGKHRKRIVDEMQPYATLVRYGGSCDGIRFGMIAFAGNHPRQFYWDRLNQSLRLYTDQSEMKPIEDQHEGRRRTAIALLLKREPIDGEDA